MLNRTNHRHSIKRTVFAAAALFAVSVLATLLVLPAEARSRAQETDTPPATVDPGAGTAYLDPTLWGILQTQSTGGQVPETIRVGMDILPHIKLDQTLADHIKSVGGSHVEGQTWDIPTSRTLEIIQRSDVFYVVLVQDSAPAGNSNLDETLNAVAIAIAAGIPATDAVQYAKYSGDGKVVVEVTTPDVLTAAAVQKWLSAQKVYVPEGQRTANSNDPVFGLLLPADQIAPMLTKFTTVEIAASNAWSDLLPLTRSRWPADALAFEQKVVATFQPPGPVFYAAHPTPGAKDAKLIKKNADTAKSRHNVDTWHSQGYKGDDVTVGIIDWGYTDFDAVASLDDLDYSATSSDRNAYCQSVYASIVPDSYLFRGATTDCEPTAGLGLYSVRHGVNIAELVNRMAPDADLLMAQANSPKQVYDAADWLKQQGADVIVHAAGWQYDSAGDGEPQLGTDLMTSSLGSDEHAPGRYYPSPLATVDEITDDDGPVWINAAGNHEKWTMWLDAPEIIDDDEDDKYYGYVIFDSTAKSDRSRTCQEVPTKQAEVIYYSMRWADTWPIGEKKLEYELDHKFPGTTYWTKDHQDSSGETQYPKNYPVRRTSKVSDHYYDLCLRIRVIDQDTDDDEAPEVPEWIQFQALIAKQSKDTGPDWESDTTGRSMVNPAESDNEALLAIGALSLLADADDPMEKYVSRGPVFADDDNITEDTPTRAKPDVVASTDGATYTKWRWDCYEKFKRDGRCGSNMYFPGTSGATAHTGGIAAVVVEWLDDLDFDYGPEDVANYLRDTSNNMSNVAHGFIELPCFSVAKSNPDFTTTGYWTSQDCNSVKRTGAKSDFYTFALDSTQNVTIDLTSSNKDAYLYLRKGLHSEGAVIAFENDNGDYGTAAQITKLLEAGAYTVEATTNRRNRPATGSYTLQVDAENPSASLSPDPSRSYSKVGYAARSYRIRSDIAIKVIANPSGEDRVLRISSRRPSSSSRCYASQSSQLKVSNGNYFYVDGCSAGDGVLEIRHQSTNELLNIYRITVHPSD